MSFGWSAGDIITAVQLLHKVGVALKDSGGASSEIKDTLAFLQSLILTLQHINSFRSISFNPEISQNVQEHYNQIDAPLQAFLSDMKLKFKPVIASSSRRRKVLSAPRKIEWALLTSKKAKELQARIVGPMVAINLLQAQQTSLSISQLPINIRDQIAPNLDAAINAGIEPLKSLLQNESKMLSEQQLACKKNIIQTIFEYHRHAVRSLESHTLENRAQVSSIEAKIEQLQTIVYSRTLRDKTSQATCLVISLLILPYVAMFLRNTLSTFFLCGDRFLFEDGLRRMKILPTAHFQHWELFYEFLVDNFRGSPGLKLVLNQQFLMLNAYNHLPISPENWTSFIQPHTKVKMAMVVDCSVRNQGSCPDPECPGGITTSTVVQCVIRICPVCKKEIAILKYDHNYKEFLSFDDSSFSLDLQSFFRGIANVTNMSLRREPQKRPPPGITLELAMNDIAAFKRVARISRDVTTPYPLEITIEDEPPDYHPYPLLVPRKYQSNIKALDIIMSEDEASVDVDFDGYSSSTFAPGEPVNSWLLYKLRGSNLEAILLAGIVKMYSGNINNGWESQALSLWYRDGTIRAP
ncbi:hypothetical protein BGZ60DRAFT_519157 [Tricladium varicosporioides]|nr:hypothetical protein BGZ60DRAFT_519157 [Hymenoscyphus varicosporioides]